MNQVILIGFLSFFLMACSDDNVDLQHYVQQIKQKKRREVLSLPQLITVSPLKLPEEVQGSPFTISETKNELYSSKHQDLKILSFEALKFVGVLSQGNEIWGLIELPDSQITRVHIGDSIGANNGYVSVIKNEFMQLEETIKNASGLWEKRIVTLDFNMES